MDITNENCKPISEINDRLLLNLCENVKELRSKSGLAVETLGEKTGVPAAILKELENGVVSDGFTAEHLVGICRFFGLGLSEIFLKP